MDHAASVLLRFPPEGQSVEILSDDVYDKQIKLHIDRVQKLFKEHAAAIASHATQLLDLLDPSANAYSYLSLLDIIIPTEAALYESVQPTIADKLVAFFVAFDPRQVRYIGSAFTHLFTAVGSGKIIPTSVAVELLARALAKIDPTGYMMTSNHLTLAKLAYHTNNATAALPVLGKDIVFFPGVTTLREPERLCNLSLPPSSYISKDTGLTLPLRSTQVLEFDYLVGLLQTSVRNWPAAHAAFARAVSYPTRDTGISKIMVEAHKLWVLTSLLVHGKSASSPPQTSSVATRVCSAINKGYLQIAENFESSSAESLLAEVQLGNETFEADGTLGLVREVVAAHPKWQIAHLRNVYSKISVSAIRQTIKAPPPETTASASAASDAEVGSLIQSMIDTGMIKAAIRRPSDGTAEGAGPSSSGPYLEFLPEAEEMTEAEFARQIAAVAAKVEALRPLHKATDERISLSRDYIRQYIRDKRREKEDFDREAPDAGLGGTMPNVLDDDLDDEDLMTDVMGGF